MRSSFPYLHDYKSTHAVANKDNRAILNTGQLESDQSPIALAKVRWNLPCIACEHSADIQGNCGDNH